MKEPILIIVTSSYYFCKCFKRQVENQKFDPNNFFLVFPLCKGIRSEQTKYVLMPQCRYTTYSNISLIRENLTFSKLAYFYSITRQDSVKDLRRIASKL